MHKFNIEFTKFHNKSEEVFEITMEDNSMELAIKKFRKTYNTEKFSIKACTLILNK
jgi:hypothetical protein